MTFETKEPPAEQVPPPKEEKAVTYRRCQRRTHCQGARADVQCWDGLAPVLSCRACLTAAELERVEKGPFADPAPKLWEAVGHE